MAKAHIGLIGLAVMGENLALNMESKGYRVAVYNRTTSVTEALEAGRGAGRNMVFAKDLESFVAALERPRRIITMVKAGAPVDAVQAQLLPLLEPGDIILDGGNSLFTDTQRRAAWAEEHGLLYLGTGVSGGEEGALRGPAIMPGGHRAAYDAVGGLLEAISAHVDGEPCCTYIGADGAGHYVKMVHNGIEYGDMQLICEAYWLLREVLGFDAARLHEVFAEWNEGELDSYLIEITRDIFAHIDEETGQPLVDLILDTAGQKGTGKWTSQSALDLGVPAPTIAEAVFARLLSAIKDERVAASSVLAGPPARRYDGDPAELVEAVRQSLYASKICSYAQGFALMASAAAEYGWELHYDEIAKIFRGGCIIRARFLRDITAAYQRDPKLPNLMLDPFFTEALARAQGAWRQVIATASLHGVPIPAFSSALAYYDAYRSARLPANLLQAQRDYFGAHTYQRTDRDGTFHTEWLPE
ncbi:MAG TPA: phosphogluconate dehydrogenase (NADP(+)-dependent, decarboxylating) [Armatimonadetes bacterium]|nr:phosphogluconate dehydrogenase (NADP(+)-dependent, decarboxylating) [Armatimonadota bacterium]